MNYSIYGVNLPFILLEIRKQNRIEAIIILNGVWCNKWSGLELISQYLTEASVENMVGFQCREDHKVRF